MPKTPSPPAAAAPDSAAASPANPASYEAALQELEVLIAQLESGQLPLAQLASGYQRGAQLLAFCRSQLDAVENQIKQLDEGQIKPWTGAA
ncbi:MAG: exodeoxyribonuclease VII small subunit [Burkholderiales bacterium]